MANERWDPLLEEMKRAGQVLGVAGALSLPQLTVEPPYVELSGGYTTPAEYEETELTVTVKSTGDGLFASLIGHGLLNCDLTVGEPTSTA